MMPAGPLRAGRRWATEPGIRAVAYAPGQFGAGRISLAVLDGPAQSDVGPVPYSPLRYGDVAYPRPTVSTDGLWVDGHPRRGNDLSKLFLPVGDARVGDGHLSPGAAAGLCGKGPTSLCAGPSNTARSIRPAPNCPPLRRAEGARRRPRAVAERRPARSGANAPRAAD